MPNLRRLRDGTKNLLDGVAKGANDVIIQAPIELGADAAKLINKGIDKVTGDNLSKEANKKIDKGANTLKKIFSNNVSVDPTSTAGAFGEGLVNGVDTSAALVNLVALAKDAPSLLRNLKAGLKSIKNSKKLDQLNLNKRLNDINEVKRRAQPGLDKLDKEFNEATKLFSTQDTPYIPQNTQAYEINNSIIRNGFDESYQLPQRYSNAIQIDDIDQIMKDFNLTREQALDYAADNLVKQHRGNTNIDYVNKHNKLNDSIRGKEREGIELDFSRDADLENASIRGDMLNEGYDYPRYNTDANINSIKKSYADAENRISKEYKTLTDEMKNFEKNHSPYTVSNYRKLKEVNTRPFSPFAF